MASFLRPRRGKKSDGISSLKDNGKLKSGEIFFEVPDDGIGKGQGRLMMGDGVSNYSDLKAFLAFDMNNVQTFSNVNSHTSDSGVTAVNSINPASPLAHNLNRIKLALLNINYRLENKVSRIVYKEFQLPIQDWAPKTGYSFSGIEYSYDAGYNRYKLWNCVIISAPFRESITDQFLTSVFEENGSVGFVIYNHSDYEYQNVRIIVRLMYIYMYDAIHPIN